MAHRAEEKERRRQERLAQEEAARKAAARRRTLQIGGGAVLGVAVIAVVAIVALAGGGDSKGESTVKTTKLAADAKAAGCTFSQFKSDGRNHTAGKVTYKTNPPTSGSHSPTPAEDGFYRAGNTPPKENYVHTLEHGRIEFQYKPGTPAADVAKLRKLAQEPFNGTAGYHVVMFENNTKMPEQFAATAWTKSIACPTLSAAALGALREFRTAFTDKGPELIP
jgi:Protein of unknown function (DUF3105)